MYFPLSVTCSILPSRHEEQQYLNVVEVESQFVDRTSEMTRLHQELAIMCLMHLPIVLRHVVVDKNREPILRPRA